MRNFSKGFLHFGWVVALIGAALLIAGFCMGGRPQDVSFSWNNGPVFNAYTHSAASTTATEAAGGAGRADVTNPSVPIDADITALDFSIGGATVTVQEGNAFDLSVSGTIDYTSVMENGVWRIKTSDDIRWSNSVPSFTITLPKDTVFSSVSLSIGAGTLKADRLSCEKAMLSVGAGTMELGALSVTGDSSMEVGLGTLEVQSGSLSGRSDINCGMGTADIAITRPADYGYAIDCGMGSVKIDGQGASGIGSDLSFNNRAATFFNVDCGMGSVDIAFR